MNELEKESMILINGSGQWRQCYSCTMVVCGGEIRAQFVDEALYLPVNRHLCPHVLTETIR